MSLHGTYQCAGGVRMAKSWQDCQQAKVQQDSDARHLFMLTKGQSKESDKSLSDKVNDVNVSQTLNTA